MTPVRTSGKRAEKARQTRQRMLTAARELFLEHGYAATTLQDVAERAGVAVQTIYFTFNNKRSLLKELVDVTIAGDDEPVATLDRPWFRAAMAQPSAVEQLRAHVHGSRSVLDRVAQISEMVTIAAATTPDLADIWRRDPDPRYVVQTAAARSLVGKPGVRPDLSVEEAADVLYGLLSTELYLLFVRERGWPPQRWERWAFDTLCAQLCASRPPGEAS
ncbi:TetR/AcrR family transcriptional regulator [Plantactinospora sp. GCM10030261]|uniref:TetR/AcrR family transcriptional regulator n=1 Tax=Plantactinospora sp. GCM10030261 TaxID=3273420 RepID=UPI00361E5D7F